MDTEVLKATSKKSLNNGKDNENQDQQATNDQSQSQSINVCDFIF